MIVLNFFCERAQLKYMIYRSWYKTKRFIDEMDVSASH